MAAVIGYTTQIWDLISPDVFTVFRPAAGIRHEKGIDRLTPIGNDFAACSIDGMNDRRRFSVNSCVGLARRIIGHIKTPAGKIIFMRNSIGPGRYGLRFQRFRMPRRGHFLANNTIEIFFHWHDVDDRKAPALGRFHNFQGSAIRIAIGNTDKSGRGQRAYFYVTHFFSGYLNGIAGNRKLNRRLGGKFFPKLSLRPDCQASRTGQRHRTASFTNTDTYILA